MRRVLWAGAFALAACAAPSPRTPMRPGASPALKKPVSSAAPAAAKTPPPSAVKPIAPVEAPPVLESTMPVSLPPQILTPLGNLNDYPLLANGGWNANWYVGYNTSWVHRLPAASSGAYARAFVGAKLGAMKTEPVPGRPTWERRVVPGEIAVALAPEPFWPQNKRYLLTMTDDIPLEGDPDNGLDGVGEARWFWAEVPLKAVSFTGDNYVALYSPDAALKDAKRSPILAAGLSNGVVDTWLNNFVRGQPPINSSDALKTPLVSYEPAVAIKLVPAREERPRLAWRRAPAREAEIAGRVALEAEVEGADVECAWLEVSTDTRAWRRIGRRAYGAPYVFTVSPDVLPRGLVHVRAVAKDFWESRGATPALPLRVRRK